MPVLRTVIPNIPATAKDVFLSTWPQIVESFKKESCLAGISGGEIVAADGHPVTEFQFLQLFAFETLEDEKAFFSSDLVKALEARKTNSTDAVQASFEVSAFPVGASPKKYTQISRITIDPTKKDELTAAWKNLVIALGQETWGGVSIGNGPSVGIGLLGWDSLEEAGVAFQRPEVATAYGKWKSLGDSKSLIVELKRY